MDETNAAENPAGPPVGFFLFGGVRIVRDGVEIEISQPKQRAILSLLLATPGEPVSLSEMTDTLWSGEPAASVTNQIHRHVGALRRICQPDLQRRQAGRYIIAAGSGYRLVVGPENCDVMKFHKAAASAHRLARAGQREEALHAYLGSLEVAAAPACDDRLATLPALVGLEDERVRAMIGAAEHCQTADEFAAVLPILRAATGRHPLNEALHAHLMTALTRTGRPAEALEVYSAIRRTLEEELGSSPSAVLEEAQAHALGGDDIPSPSRAEPVTSRPATVVPAQLPSAPPGFAGRQATLAALRDDPGDRSRPLLITGMAGVGKTTLACRVAHELAPDYPDGQLYVNLRGFDATAAPTDPLDALRDMLEGLGVPAQGQPESTAARSGLLRSILSKKRVLVVLDNAHDYQQVDPLLPGVGASRAVITSRNRMPSLSAVHQAQPIELEPFDDQEIVEFFIQRLPLSLIDEDRAAMIRLGQACGGLPLALSIIAARASTNPAFPLDLLVREFTQEPTPLASLNAGSADLDLGSVFSWSQRGLSEDAAHTFLVLGAHPGPEITTAAAASMSALEPRRAREVLTELTLANILRETQPGRFTLHDLVRQHALSLLGDQSGIAAARLVNHYVRSTRNAILTFGRPGIAPIDHTVPGIEPERFASTGDTYRWYDLERRTLQAVCRLAMTLGDYRSALMLILDWRPMSQNVDATTDILPWAELALQAAHHVEEPILKAESYREAAAKLARTGDTARARTFFDLAAATFTELGDRAGQANLYRNMALTLATDPQESVDLLRRSLAIARDLENPPVLAASLQALGYALSSGLADHTGAADVYTECLAIATTEGLPDIEGQARTGIVRSLTASHDYETAVKETQPLLALLLREPSPKDELEVLDLYGDALTGVGRHAEAGEAWRRYLELATPELASYEDSWRRRSGEEVIAEVRAKLEALMAQEQASSAR